MEAKKFDTIDVEKLFLVFSLDFPLVCFRVISPINPSKILDDYAEWSGFDRGKLRYDMIPMIEYKDEMNDNTN